MRQVQINKNLILREDGKLFNVHTGEEFIPKTRSSGNIQYIIVYLMHKRRRLHQLVMQFFGPPKPAKNYEIDHIDRNPENNSISNLRWVTRQENTNNRGCTLPVGERLCDLPLKEYKRQRYAEYCKKYPEKHREANKRWRDKKKEGV